MSVTIPKAVSPIVACTPPRRSHRWDRSMREIRRKTRAVKERVERESDWEQHRAIATKIFQIVVVMCKARTSAGKVGKEYGALRKLLKEYTEIGGVFGPAFKTTVRHHVQTNARDLLPSYRAYVDPVYLYMSPQFYK